MVSNFDQLSQFQGEAVLPEQAMRDQRLDSLLGDVDQDMPFPASADAEKFRRDDDHWVG